MTGLLSAKQEKELIEFAQSLVRIKSLPGQEGEIIKHIEKSMNSLGYDETVIDSMGNVLGRIGDGEKILLFDSHVDTVDVTDPEMWKVSPYGGEILDGLLYGRGSVDMKSGSAASIYAALIARESGFASGKTIYVSCSVYEEDCEGENLKHLFEELHLRPDYVMICEPSNNTITLGHKGKAQIKIKTRGLSAHSSTPELGANAVYEMAEIIQRVEKTNHGLQEKEGIRASLNLSRISSVAASLNAVPSECEIYLDRRMIPGETEDTIHKEIDQLIEGKNASWEVDRIHRMSWKGTDIDYVPYHLAWKTDITNELTQACITAYRVHFKKDPGNFGFWDFSTNAVTPVSMGIPTIGFGPGNNKRAHMRDENCEVTQILDACGFYTRLIQKL